MKKFRLLLFIVTLTALVACSSGKEERVSGSKDDGGSKNVEEKTTAELWTIEGLKDRWEPMMEDFEKEFPEYKIKLSTKTTDGHKEALRVAASSGTLPTAWFNWGGSLGYFYPENGLTLDLKQRAEQDNWEELYVEPAINLAKYEEQIMGVPVSLNALGVFYRKDIFDKYGIEEPTTFEELEKVMANLKANDITPISVGGKFGWQTMRFTEMILEHYAGPELKDKLMSLEESWDNPAVIKTYEKLKEWEEKGYFPKGFITADPNEVKIPFYSGDAAMLFDGTWFEPGMVTDEFDIEKSGLFSFPTDQDPVRTSSFVEVIQINKSASQEQQEAVYQFAIYINSKEVLEKYSDQLSYPSVTKGIEVPDNFPNTATVVEGLNKGTFTITDQALPQEMIVKFFEAQDNVILGELTPEEAAKLLQSASEEYTSK